MDRLQIVRILIEHNLRVNSIKKLVDIASKYTILEAKQSTSTRICFYDGESQLGYIYLIKGSKFLLHGESLNLDDLIDDIFGVEFQSYSNKEFLIEKVKIIFAILINFRS